MDVWSSLRVESRTLITALKTGVDGGEVAELHRPILEALRARDPERAAAAIGDHLQLFATLVKGAAE